MQNLARPNSRRIAWSVLLCAAVLLFSGGDALAAPAGTVVGLSGACSVESGGSRGAAKMGQQLQVGDTIEVPADGKMKVRLTDGSIVSVAANTRVTVASLGVDATGQRQEVRLSLAQGLLRAAVARVQQAARFEVATAVGTAAVRSTDWFVEATPNGMRVGVLTGSVDMTSTATRRAVTIPARYGARMERGGDPATPKEWSQADFDAVIARTAVP